MITAIELEAILTGAGLSHALLDEDPAVIYVLDSNLRIVHCNRAWESFAAENEGKNLKREEIQGKAVLAVIPEPLQQFYAQAMRGVQETQKIWEHDFECSSPEVFRLFHMRMIRLPNSFLLVENSLRIEERHELDDFVLNGHFNYINEHGIITCCCHCRRTLRVSSSKTPVWDWIPRLLVGPSRRVSHGLCYMCRRLFYPFVQSGARAQSQAE